MKTFTISTILFLVTIVALVISNIIAWKEAATAVARLRIARAEFGIIDDAARDKTRIHRFVHDDYRNKVDGKNHSGDAYRIAPAQGSRYVLHVGELFNPQLHAPSTQKMKPLKTIELDDWRSGAVLVCSIFKDGEQPRVLISADAETLLDFNPPNFVGDVSATTKSWPDLATGGTKEFAPNRRIRLHWWYADRAERGYMLWLEPREAWEQRKSQAGETTNRVGADDPIPPSSAKDRTHDEDRNRRQT